MQVEIEVDQPTAHARSAKIMRAINHEENDLAII